MRNTELTNEYLLSVGKALYLASEFEKKCQFVLRIRTIVDHIEENGSDPSVFDFMQILKDPLPGPTLKKLGTLSKVVDAQLEALNRAREARNYIAHKAGLLGGQPELSASHFNRLRRKLGEELEHLIRGDNIVSRWVYEIEEKEPAPRHMAEIYADLVREWVFENHPRKGT